MLVAGVCNPAFLNDSEIPESPRVASRIPKGRGRHSASRLALDGLCERCSDDK
jgi:hypothetical protein